MIRACPLFSGSSGNSIYISDGHTSLLVDAGQCGRTIERALTAIDVLPASLAAILVTHEHIDHVRGVGVMMRRYNLPLYVNKETWRAMCLSRNLGRIDPELVHLFPTGEPFAIGDLCIHAVPVPHDAADPVGYRIAAANRQVAVFTDLGHLTPAATAALSAADLVFFESNYDSDMLYQGSYPWPLKRRIDGQHGHLSNADCAAALPALLRGGVKRFVLAHLSKENNTPDLAYTAARAALAGCGAVEGSDYLLEVAPRHSPGRLWEL